MSQPMNLDQLLAAFNTLQQQNELLQQQISQLQKNAVPTTTVSPVTTKDPRMPDVETYDGKNVLKAREFILQLDIFFNSQPNRYYNDKSKLSYASSRLRDIAFSWVSPYLILNDKGETQSYENFKTEFLNTFGEQDRITNAEAKLRRLKQGNRAAALLAAEVRTLSVDVSWNESALISAFYEGLNDDVKDKLCSLDLPTKLNEYMALTIKIDNRLFQ